MSDLIEQAQRAFCEITHDSGNGKTWTSKGIFIAPDEILTAAHPLRNSNAFQFVQANMDSGQLREADQKLKARFGLDVAIIKLAEPVTDDWVAPAGKKSMFFSGQRLLITGISEDSPIKTLKKDKVATRQIPESFKRAFEVVQGSAGELEAFRTSVIEDSDAAVGAPIINSKGQVTSILINAKTISAGQESLIVVPEQNALANFIEEPWPLQF